MPWFYLPKSYITFMIKKLYPNRYKINLLKTVKQIIFYHFLLFFAKIFQKFIKKLYFFKKNTNFFAKIAKFIKKLKTLEILIMF